jgi:Dolichyl-phosphate-mannose-protein mannosyltransferase
MNSEKGVNFSYKQFYTSDYFIFFILSLFVVLVHLYTNAFASYGYFRDELHYLACANHLSWGYVDQPPFSIFILAVSRFLFGASLFALRLLPAIVSGLIVFITGLMVKKIGGGRIAVTIACLSMFAAPIFLAMGTYYSMNIFDWLFWVLAAYIIILIIAEDEYKHWIGLGIILGLGLLNKIDILWFGFALFVALLITEQRKQLKTKFPYIGVAIALIMFLPFIIWNFTHDWATLQFMHNATQYKYASITRLDFITGLIKLLNPFTIPVWFGGLYFFFFLREGKKYKTVGIIFIVSFLVLLINGRSKPEYLSPAFPMLFAGGGIFIEKAVNRKYWTWLKYALPSLLLLSGIAFLPFAIPILPVTTYISYSKELGVAPSSSEGKKLNQLPQFYADMFGWENMAAQVSRVYESMTEEERKNAIVFAQNYGEAGAIDFYRNKYPLPPVICTHNNYWIWGYGSKEAKVIIIIGGKMEDNLKALKEVKQVGVIKNEYCMPYENNLPIFIGRGLKIPIEKIWEAEKHFI